MMKQYGNTTIEALIELKNMLENENQALRK